MVFLWKGIRFEANEEDLRKRSSELKSYYGGRRPTVPLLLHNGEPIFESLDIMEYLEKFSDKNALSFTDFRKWGDWSAKELRDGIQLYKYDEGAREEGMKQVQDCFALLEEALGPYLTGSSIALADFAVWPFVRQALGVKPCLISMGPKLEKWFLEIEGQSRLKDLMKK